jgi:hypothetical protein
MSDRLKTLSPALCSAGELIVSSAIAAFTMQQALLLPLQMLGPLAFAASILGCDVLTARAQGLRRGPSPTAIFLALTFLAAMLITAWGDAKMVPVMLPILGGGIASPLLDPNKKPTKPSMQYPAEDTP